MDKNFSYEIKENPYRKSLQRFIFGHVFGKKTQQYCADMVGSVTDNCIHFYALSKLSRNIIATKIIGL